MFWTLEFSSGQIPAKYPDHTTHFGQSVRPEHFQDKESFLCFDFVSDEFCGKVDVQYHKRYTKQIFDFFDKNFPGVNIGEGKRSQTNNDLLKNLRSLINSVFVVKRKTVIPDRIFS